ncbi:MAG: hypothetical protein ACFFB2_00190 [Promethearchaeota archaeon]
MKLAEKTIDSVTRLKLKSGTAIEIHMINQDNKASRLIIERDDKGLTLENDEISDFIALFNEFLEGI